MAQEAVNPQTIIDMRRLAGMKPATLAARAGVSASYLCEIEKGRKQPSVEILKKLADALGVSIVSLLAPRPQDSAPTSAGVSRAS